MTPTGRGTAPSSLPPRRRVRRAAAALAAALVLAAGITVGTAVLGDGGTAAAACSMGKTALRSGDRGPAVACVQRALTDRGFSPGSIDGIFGSMTRSAVISFQRARGLTADGVVGRATGRALGIWGAMGCRPPSSVPDDARQVLLVDASGTTAVVDLLVKRSTGWRCARTGMFGRVGKNGIRPLSQRVAGDGTTPAGTFRLGSVVAPDGQRFSFFGLGSDPGVAWGWRQVRSGDCWDATGGDATYNRLVRRAAAACPYPDEYLPRFEGAYSRAALIGANLGRHRSGDEPGEVPRAAAIFLHRHSYDAAGTRPTAGCVSLAHKDLAAVLRAMRPGEAVFVIR